MPSTAAHHIDDELRAFFLGPVSSMLGTADQLHTPDATRVAGIAPLTSTRVRVLIAADAAAAQTNAALGARCSLLVTDITNYRSIQWKGTVARESHERTPGDLAVMHRHIDAFDVGAKQVRLLPGVVHALFPVDVVALEIELDSRYDQTPGPGAGRRVA
ncbi:MAG TPA: hypothetical protein VMM60_05530 [Ilumatobacter sp.]|nr:hypothetical protein [Ilumatobacter sp.]